MGLDICLHRRRMLDFPGLLQSNEMGLSWFKDGRSDTDNPIATAGRCWAWAIETADWWLNPGSVDYPFASKVEGFNLKFKLLPLHTMVTVFVF